MARVARVVVEGNESTLCAVTLLDKSVVFARTHKHLLDSRADPNSGAVYAGRQKKNDAALVNAHPANEHNENV
jgi:hypothetical protein